MIPEGIGQGSWSEPDETRGVELSVEESIALWNWLQRNDSPPYWDNPDIASLAEKLKSFHKRGPWESNTGTEPK